MLSIWFHHHRTATDAPCYKTESAVIKSTRQRHVNHRYVKMALVLPDCDESVSLSSGALARGGAQTRGEAKQFRLMRTRTWQSANLYLSYDLPIVSTGQRQPELQDGFVRHRSDGAGAGGRLNGLLDRQQCQTLIDMNTK